MKSKPNKSKHSQVKKEWSVLFKKAIRESKKKKRFIKEKMKEEENKKKSADEKAIQHGRDCTARETIPMKIFASSTGHPSTHHQEHGRLWIRHVCGEQKKMVVQWNWSNKCGDIQSWRNCQCTPRMQTKNNVKQCKIHLTTIAMNHTS